MINIVEMSHEILAKHKSPKISLDMTCGHGHDSLFLSNISEKVYAFDIQEIAISNTRSLLADNQINNCEVIQDSHENFYKYVNDKIDLAIFKLGYLPKGDKKLMTEASIVLKALQKLMNCINYQGIIVLVAYHHNYSEVDQLIEFTSGLNNDWDVIMHKVLNKHESPIIIEMTKVKK